MCYHTRFGSYMSNGVNTNRGELPELGSAGFCLLGLGVVADRLNTPLSKCYPALRMHLEATIQIFSSTGIRGLMRGMATLPRCNQELLVVRDKVGRPQVRLG